jgi:hypothetical protein
MVKKYIRWIPPETAEGYTHVRIEKSSNGGVTYSEFTTSNDPDYTANGLVVTDTDAVDLLGASDHWYKIRFYDSVNDKYSDYSDAMRGSDFRGYCTITDVRNYTNVQSGEYSDTALQMMIDTTTSVIDKQTGKTWQGVETETDAYFDGNGRDYLFISDDLVSIVSLAIDDDDDGTYTSISSAYYKVYIDKGGIWLDSDSPVPLFTKGRQTVKISYTHGFADPTDDVRHLCLLMVANMMKMDATRTSIIDSLKNSLSAVTYENTDVGSCENSGY